MFSLGILLLSFGAIFLALGIVSLVISEINKESTNHKTKESTNPIVNEFPNDKKFGKNGWRKE